MNKAHEKLLFRYSSALERGDFQAVADVLREAERDPLLEQMILDMNEAYAETPGRFNHTNPKEVPMIAPLYQRRAPAPVRWHSLPLIAALAVIAVLTVLLANQIRGSMLAANGDGDQPPVQAQAQPLCVGVTRAPVDVHSRALSASAIIGALSSSAPVTVYDQESITSGGAAEGWYFITAEGVAGWVPAQALDAAACQSQQMMIFSSPTPTAYLMANTVLPATIVPAQAGCSPSLGANLLPVTLASRPGRDAQIVAQATSVDPHAVTLLDSTIVAGETWYYVRVDTLPLNQQGWMPAEQYDVNVTCPLINRGELPTAIPSDIQVGTALPPTVVPPAIPQPTQPPLIDTASGDLAPTLVPPLVEAFPATPQYYVYVVQPGDTLFSILARFHLDPSALPDVMRVNNLTEDSLVAPGITLYVPASQQLISLACRITAAQRLDLLVRPASDATVIGTIPPGADFELTDRSQQTDGVWYAVTLQVEGVTVTGGWLRPGTVAIPLDCQHAVPGTVITLVPSQEATAVSPDESATPTAARSSGALDSCLFDTQNAVTLYAQPSTDALAVELLHTGTPLQIWMLTSDWYSVQERYPDGPGNSGFVRVNALTLPNDCLLTPAMVAATMPPIPVLTATLLPTSTPLPR